MNTSNLYLDVKTLLIMPLFSLGVVNKMPERKHKRESRSLIELDSEALGFVLEPTQVELGSGYTISVSYDENEKQIVNVRTYGEVDIAKLRREIEQAFPNAQIRQLDQKGSVTIAKRRRRKRSVKKR